MSRRPIALLALSLAAAGGVAAVAAAGGAAQTSPRTLTLLERDKGSKTTYVDNAPRSRRPAAGDQIVFTIPLFDAAGSTRQGTLAASCTVTRKKSGEPPMNCEGVFALRDGDLVVAGRLTPGVQHLAIVGGTGAYAGARGTVDSTESKAGTQDTVTLLP